MKYARSRKKWSKQEKEALSAAFANSAVHPKHVLIPDRSPDAVERMARKMNLIKRSAPPHWSPKERASLRRLHRRRLTTVEMFESDAFLEPLRSRYAIEKKRSKLRLIHSRRRSSAAKHRKIWQDGEFEHFEEFLRNNSNHLATEEIAKLFHVSKPAVRAHQRRLGVNLSWQEAMRLPYNIRKKQLGIQKLRRKLLKHHRQKETQRKKQLVNLARRYRQRYPDVPEKTCSVCQLSFPKSRHFYYYRDVRGSSFTSRLFDCHCKACTSIHRRQKRRKDRRHTLRKARQLNNSLHKNPVD